jgi:hypothetical protein
MQTAETILNVIRQAGEPCEVKVSSTVRRGEPGKVPVEVTRPVPTLLVGFGSENVQTLSCQNITTQPRRTADENVQPSSTNISTISWLLLQLRWSAQTSLCARRGSLSWTLPQTTVYLRRRRDKYFSGKLDGRPFELIST